MTREDTLKAAIKKFEDNKDPTKVYPPPDHFAIREFWLGRAKIKWDWYKKNKGL